MYWKIRIFFWQSYHSVLCQHIFFRKLFWKFLCLFLKIVTCPWTCWIHNWLWWIWSLLIKLRICTFTEEILNGKPHFLCSERVNANFQNQVSNYSICTILQYLWNWINDFSVKENIYTLKFQKWLTETNF